jgi:hypothetical protein
MKCGLSVNIMNIVYKWYQAFEIFYGIMFPFIVIGALILLGYISIKVPIILLFLGAIIIPHFICEYFEKKYKNQTRNDAFVGGENYK